MLQAIDEAAGLWHAEGEMRMPGGVRLPLRMTVIRLDDGTILLHSPIPCDDALAAEIDGLGEVAHLVAPNCLHYLYLKRARERWPRATIHAAPGLADKLKGVTADHELGAGSPWPGIELAVIAGAPRVGEVLLLHRASKTLICTDLLFNMQTWRGAATGLVLWLFGTRGRLACSRLLARYLDDREAVRASLAPVLAWPFERIVMAHGQIFEAPDAPAQAAAALSARLGPIG